MSDSQLFVGTSGYRYWPGDVFPPKTSTEDALRLYAEKLGSVELNRTFYQLPRATSVVRWKELVPDSFVWAAKISRKISHEKRLIDADVEWETFLERLSPLANPRGVLLLQLSKTFPQELDRLHRFLSLGRGAFRMAVEFRHSYWFQKKTYDLLERHCVALVGVSAPGVERVLDVPTAPFVYYRLHGPRAWYKDRYTLDELRPFLEAARQAIRAGCDAYVYFDNTIGGHAYWNALEFQDALSTGGWTHENVTLSKSQNF